MHRTMLISGFFTDDDWKELSQLLRRIEQKHSDELYQMHTLGGERTLEENLKFLQENFPKKMPEQPVDTWVFKQVDTK